MKSIEYDLRYLKSGLDVLEEYLLSGEVFWPLGAKPPAGEPEYPQLTLDWILLIRTRLEGRHLSGDQKEAVERAIAGLNLNRSKWRVAWEKKASQCYQVRGRMWRDYMQEYQEIPQDNADRYSYEVRLRVMLELLRGEFKRETAEVEFLEGLDSYLRSVLVPGEFIWEAEIQAGFPEGEYWFLYGKLPASLKKH